MRIQKINEIKNDYQQNASKKNKRLKKTYIWIRLLLGICLVLVIIILFCMTPLFNITEFYVQNSTHYDRDTLIDLANISIGENGFKFIGISIEQILGLRYGKCEQNILENCPYIKEVKVKYEIPNSVKINFTEREPAGSVPYLGSNLIVDNEGYVLDIVKDISSYNLLTIKGLRFNNYELGQKLSTENPESLNAVINVLDVIKTSDKKDRFKLLEMIISIDVGDLKKINMLIDFRIVLNLGDTDELEYKIAATKQILLKNVKKEDKGLLDFTIGENPTFIPDLN
jgi:cell division protein FtsQ